MIGPKDILDENNKYICFHCTKKDMSQERAYTVTLGTIGNAERYSPSETFGDRAGTFKRVVFHIECWKEIAGDEFMFSEE